MLTLASVMVVVGCKRPPPPVPAGPGVGSNANANEPSAKGGVVAYPGGMALVGDVGQCEVMQVGGGAGVTWRRSLAPCDGRLAIAVAPDSTAYARTASALVAFSMNGAERWRIAVGSEPVPAAIFAPATTLDSLVVVASSSHAALAVKGDGSEAWRFRVSEDEPIVAPPAPGGGEGALVLTVRAVYLVGSDGGVHWRRDVVAPPPSP